MGEHYGPGERCVRRTVMMMAVAFLASGCIYARWVDLKKPAMEQHFVLTSDHVRTISESSGPAYVEILRAGVYRLEAEDEDGLYFRGEGACVARLFDKAAREYMETGKATAPEVAPGYIPRGQAGYLSGGLKLPKKTGREPKLFFIPGQGGLNPEAAAAAAGAVPPQSGAQGIGTGLGWAMADAAAGLDEGRAIPISYGSEKDFVATIRIVDGPPALPLAR